MTDRPEGTANPRLPPVWQPDPLPGRPPGVPLPGAVPCELTRAAPALPVPPVTDVPLPPPPVPAAPQWAAPPQPQWPGPAQPQWPGPAQPGPYPWPPQPPWPGPPPAMWPPMGPGPVPPAGKAPSRRRRHWLIPVLGSVLIVVGVVLGVVAARSSGPPANNGQAHRGPVAPAETALVVVTTNLRTETSEVVPVDMATGTTTAPIRVPAGAEAIATTGGTAYVLAAGTGKTGPGSLTPIDLSSDAPGAAISIPGVPVAMTVTADGSTAYVISIHGTVTEMVPVTLATGSVGPPVTVRTGTPSETGIQIAGETAYVSSLAAGTLTPVDLSTGTVGTPIDVGAPAGPFAIGPDGRTAYVTNPENGRHVLQTVTPVDLATGQAGTPIHVGKGPQSIAITPDGRLAVVTNGGTTTLSTDTVTTIDLATGKASAPIRVGTGPVPVAVDRQSRWAVVGNTGVARAVGSTVTFVDLLDHAPGWTVPVHGLPDAVAIVGQTPT